LSIDDFRLNVPSREGAPLLAIFEKWVFPSMDVESIRHFCLSFPDAKENLQWGEDLCFKVRGKIFAVLDLGSAPQRLSFKCTPEKFAELTEQEGISPAPYVGRYKWALLERLSVLSAPELKDLIRESYAMVASKTKVKTSSRGAREVSRKKKKR
jgi:predicted DNA-binding protein (MmcQ/YjbR family)